jgi:hypothetical protein
MEHAIWTKCDSQRKYVSIQEVKRQLGEDSARRQTYNCPSEKCGVKMITVFPKKIRRGANEVHSDHFRATKQTPHKANCDGDGAREFVGTSSTGIETGAKPRHDVVEQASYPIRYVRHYRPSLDEIDKGTGGDVRPPPDVLTDVDETEDRRTTHFSDPGTGHIRGMVEAFENNPEDLSRMKIRLPKCPARNYADAFRHVDSAVNQVGRAGASFIYYGPYLEHHTHWRHAKSIIFANLSADGKKLGVWIKAELLSDEVSRQKIAELIVSAERFKPLSIVYVFGRFQPFREWKHSIEIEALGDLWITFPGGLV